MCGLLDGRPDAVYVCLARILWAMPIADLLGVSPFYT